MITVRRSKDRGHANHGWLDTFHTFSFASYQDPRFMGFRSLRVINEDRVRGGQGFPTHPHQDMEIVTYVLEGALEHKDSMGNGSVIRPGDVQRMTAGTGVTHSEYNHSATAPVHLLQIWLLPEESALEPGYEQKTFSHEEKRGRLCRVGARGGEGGAVTIHQDVDLFASILERGAAVRHSLAKGRYAWLQVARGAVMLNDQPLQAGDGAAVRDQSEVQIAGKAAESEILLFDLA